MLLLSHAVVEATQGTAANESHPSQNAKKQTFLNAEAGERVLLGLTRRARECQHLDWALHSSGRAIYKEHTHFLQIALLATSRLARKFKASGPLRISCKGWR